MAPPDKDVSAGSILRELILNQYQAIVVGGAALASLVDAQSAAAAVSAGLGAGAAADARLGTAAPPGRAAQAGDRPRRGRRRTRAPDCRPHAAADASATRRWRSCAALIETNYQSLTGISQAYLSEQRGKLDTILQGYLHRLMAVQRYERLPAGRTSEEVEEEIEVLERELAEPDLPERAAAALKKNLELKRRLLTSLSEVGGTVKALVTELDSIESLLEVLHQNSISLRDPQAISRRARHDRPAIGRLRSHRARDGVAAQRRERRLAGRSHAESTPRPRPSRRSETRDVRRKRRSDDQRVRRLSRAGRASSRTAFARGWATRSCCTATRSIWCRHRRQNGAPRAVGRLRADHAVSGPVGVRATRCRHRVPARQRRDLPHARVAQALHRCGGGRRCRAWDRLRHGVAARAGGVLRAARFVSQTGRASPALARRGDHVSRTPRR